MNIRAVAFDALTSDELAAWSTIQRAERLLASPFFRPEFTRAVAAVRNDVEVAVLEKQGQPIGFFPFQRARWNSGQPVGGILSDFQGLIAPANVSCDPQELVRACRLTSWHFGHLLTAQSSFAPYVWREADSPYIDLSEGFDGYIAQKKNGRRILSECRRDLRRLERDFGPMRYEANVSDQSIVSTFFAWKRSQFRRTNVPDIFAYSWVRDLLEKILEYGRECFSSIVSVMYAGDTVAAINFGMRSTDVLHPWFPVYNVELANYSPGQLHWIETMRACDSLGIRRIDFGKGPEPYKRRLMNGVDTVAEGTVDVLASSAMVRRTWRTTREHIRRSPLARPVRLQIRLARRVKHWLSAP